MVTTTHDEDGETVTHDAFGTDLRRVRGLLASGCDALLIAEALGINIHRARYAITVATDDREGAPDPDQVASLCREIQSGWTPEQAAAARHGEPRLSSSVVRPNASSRAERAAAVAAYWAERRRHMVYDRPVTVRHHPEYRSALRFEVFVRYQNNHARRFFATREQAEAFGREWLIKRHERQAGACCTE
jgi:hypothetical protein